jgi:hypothetical protein
VRETVLDYHLAGTNMETLILLTDSELNGRELQLTNISEIEVGIFRKAKIESARGLLLGF